MHNVAFQWKCSLEMLSNDLMCIRWKFNRRQSKLMSNEATVFIVTIHSINFHNCLCIRRKYSLGMHNDNNGDDDHGGCDELGNVLHNGSVTKATKFPYVFIHFCLHSNSFFFVILPCIAIKEMRKFLTFFTLWHNCRGTKRLKLSKYAGNKRKRKIESFFFFGQRIWPVLIASVQWRWTSSANNEAKKKVANLCDKYWTNGCWITRRPIKKLHFFWS